MTEKEKENGGSRIVPVNPAPFIKSLFGKKIAVKLKWGMEYRGVLSCADAYMNLQLRDCEEFIDDILQSELPKLMIRCNNILYIRLADPEPEESSSS